MDFFLDVLEMFQTWLAATREQLAEQKVQNEAHINEITNMLSMNHHFLLIDMTHRTILENIIIFVVKRHSRHNQVDIRPV